MVRVRSRKNNSYFVSSPLTCLTVSGLLAGWAGGQQERRWGRGVLQGGGGEVVEGVAGVEGVASLVWAVQCGGCGSQVATAACTYVGCRVVGSLHFSVTAVLQVITGGKMVSVISTSEEDIRTMLGADQAGWDLFKKKVAMEGRVSLKTDSDLASFVEDLVSTAGYFIFKARRMSASQDVSYYCLKAWRISNIEMNNLYEQALQ